MKTERRISTDGKQRDTFIFIFYFGLRRECFPDPVEIVAFPPDKALKYIIELFSTIISLRFVVSLDAATSRGNLLLSSVT